MYPFSHTFDTFQFQLISVGGPLIYEKSNNIFWLSLEFSVPRWPSHIHISGCGVEFISLALMLTFILLRISNFAWRCGMGRKIQESHGKRIRFLVVIFFVPFAGLMFYVHFHFVLFPDNLTSASYQTSVTYRELPLPFLYINLSGTLPVSTIQINLYVSTKNQSVNLYFRKAIGNSNYHWGNARWKRAMMSIPADFMCTGEDYVLSRLETVPEWMFNIVEDRKCDFIRRAYERWYLALSWCEDFGDILCRLAVG